MSYHPKYCTLAYVISCLLDAVDGQVARALGQTSKFGAVLDMVTDRCVISSYHSSKRLLPYLTTRTSSCTTSCLLCYLSSAYPNFAMVFQFLIALDFASHYMHMYRCVLSLRSCLSSPHRISFSSLVTGSRSHKLVTSEVSRILWYYYNDSVRFPPFARYGSLN